MGALPRHAAVKAAAIFSVSNIFLDAGDTCLCPGLDHQRRRHRVDDRRHCAGADDDHTGAGAVLCRHGAQEERAGDDGAKPRSGGRYFNSMGGVRLFAGIRRRRTMDRIAGSLVSRRHDHGRRQSAGEDDSGSTVHALPDDLRDHHGGAGGGCCSRPHALLGVHSVLHRLVHLRLRAAGALGVGRRLPGRGRRDRFRRWPRGAFERRHRRAGRGQGAGQVVSAMARTIYRLSICRWR